MRPFPLRTVLAAGVGAAVLAAGAASPAAAQAPATQASTPFWRTLNAAADGTYVVRDFTFASGERLEEINLYYRTLGAPRRDASGRIVNAVLMLHGSSGDASQVLSETFGGNLYGPGQPLDANVYFIILPDSLGNGGSTKPSDGLKGAFPRYGYHDQVELQRRLVADHFGVERLRLVAGMSMGGMHTWLWGFKHPEMMDALIPMSSLPAAINGRNLLWRRIFSDAVRNDPTWRGGDYETVPQGFKTAMAVFDMMVQSPIAFDRTLRTYEQADAYLTGLHQETIEEDDPNNVLWRFESSFDYDPQPEDLRRIQAPLLTILFADDALNPLEIPVIEPALEHVADGQLVVIPAEPGHYGHRGQVRSELFAHEIAAFMARTAPRGGDQ